MKTINLVISTECRFAQCAGGTRYPCRRLWLRFVDRSIAAHNIPKAIPRGLVTKGNGVVAVCVGLRLTGKGLQSVVTR